MLTGRIPFDQLSRWISFTNPQNPRECFALLFFTKSRTPNENIIEHARERWIESHRHSFFFFGSNKQISASECKSFWTLAKENLVPNERKWVFLITRIALCTFIREETSHALKNGALSSLANEKPNVGWIRTCAERVRVCSAHPNSYQRLLRAKSTHSWSARLPRPPPTTTIGYSLPKSCTLKSGQFWGAFSSLVPTFGHFRDA